MDNVTFSHVISDQVVAVAFGPVKSGRRPYYSLRRGDVFRSILPGRARARGGPNDYTSHWPVLKRDESGQQVQAWPTPAAAPLGAVQAPGKSFGNPQTQGLTKLK